MEERRVTQQGLGASETEGKVLPRFLREVLTLRGGVFGDNRNSVQADRRLK